MAGPRYAVIETSHDAVVTPYQNAFLTGPNVTNILIQDQCPANPAGLNFLSPVPSCIGTSTTVSAKRRCRSMGGGCGRS